MVNTRLGAGVNRLAIIDERDHAGVDAVDRGERIIDAVLIHIVIQAIVPAIARRTEHAGEVAAALEFSRRDPNEVLAFRQRAEQVFTKRIRRGGEQRQPIGSARFRQAVTVDIGIKFQRDAG